MVALAGLFSCALTAIGQLLGTWWWPLELASHFTAFYWIALLPATAVSFSKTRQRRLWLGAICGLALLWNSVLLAPSFAPRAFGYDGSGPLRVMTLNVRTRNTRFDEVLKYVENEDPDVLVLCEVDQRWLAAMAPLAERYPTIQAEPKEHNFGIAFYSRLPTDEISLVEFVDRQIPSIAATVGSAGRRVRLLATHPLPPGSQQTARQRNEQLAAIAQWSTEQEAPVIVMGDLNITRWSPYFRRLLRESGLDDSSRGFGLRSTWRVRPWLPGIPIDHVLLSPELEVLDRRVGPEVGSDHRGVTVDVGWGRSS